MNHPELKPIMYRFRENWTIFVEEKDGKPFYHAGKLPEGGCLCLDNLEVSFGYGKCQETDSLEFLIYNINLFENREGINDIHRSE